MSAAENVGIDPSFLRHLTRDRIGQWVAMNATAWDASFSNL